MGARHGLTLDPARYEDARAAAREGLQRHPELHHDAEIWVAFTTDIIKAMGGTDPGAREAALEMTRAWDVHANFDLYDDVQPVLARLRAAGLKIGLITNSGRDMDEFLAHHSLPVDAALASGAHGLTKPHDSIFRAVLAQLGVQPEDAAMVGDSLEDDIDGARALGMRAFLLDRDGRYPGRDDSLPDLHALPAALGIPD
jgi:HAD superfamily hydrolase (TIGR01662 family)